jgi:hypothetical protein
VLIEDRPMPIKTAQLAQIAEQIAAQVRRLIPRSSNRYLDSAEAVGSDWLKTTYSIQYGEFIHTVVRAGTKGPGQATIKQKETKTNFCFPKTKYRDASIKSLRDAVLDFIQNGTIEGRGIDLNYKPGMAAEKAYSAKFGAGLADYLNTSGFRDGRQRFTARNVMQKVKNELAQNDRMIQSLRMSERDAFENIHGVRADRSLMFPPRYIAASARNACKYGVGNCEECGCLAFAMFLTLKRPDGTAIVALADEERPRVELVQAKSEGDSHFFVLVNRPGSNDIFDDFDNWFANPKTIACDPWITDHGVGGPITATSLAMRELQDYLQSKSGRPEFLAVRATGFLGKVPEDFKNDPNFCLPGE